ncbi:circadian clock protein KaiA [Synechococcus sp. Nb3U1]|uniref:circadian clock protein KaiA n=1 Tax=Synechococcus sp. Nb3U1 TaxID=1914529 RepID=UPI002E247CC6
MNPSTQPLRICLLQAWDPLDGEPLVCESILPPQRFASETFREPDLFLKHLHQQNGSIDCLVLLVDPVRLEQLERIGNQLCEWGLLLPTVLVLVLESSEPEPSPEETCPQRGRAQALPRTPHAAAVNALLKREQFFYHNATLVRSLAPRDLLMHTNGISPLELLIERAIALFLQVSPTCGLPQGQVRPKEQAYLTYSNQQQQHLAEKLRERLGYAGVYYHRDPTLFYRRLPEPERRALMQRLRGLYQTIVLEYFQSPETANARIDELVALAFFADIGAAQLLELHMGLMEDFAKQLKLEGRNEEILLDYRITLIDVMAHLSEMYRRSIPKPAPRDP